MRPDAGWSYSILLTCRTAQSSKDSMNRSRFLAVVGAAATLPRGRISSPADVQIAPVRFPYVQNVQADRATVMWTTLEAGLGRVDYTTDGVTYRSAAARSRTFSS